MTRKSKSNESMFESVDSEGQETVSVQQDSNFSETAYGLFKDKTTGEWVVTELSYDPNTLQVANTVKLIPCGDNIRAIGQERFRITVARNLFSKGD